MEQEIDNTVRALDEDKDLDLAMVRDKLEQLKSLQPECAHPKPNEEGKVVRPPSPIQKPHDEPESVRPSTLAAPKALGDPDLAGPRATEQRDEPKPVRPPTPPPPLRRRRVPSPPAAPVRGPIVPPPTPPPAVYPPLRLRPRSPTPPWRR